LTDEGRRGPGSGTGRLAVALFCALALATLIALAVIQQVRLDGVVLDLARVTRVTGDAATPQHRVEVEFRMRKASDDAVVRIVNDEDEPVATLVDGEPLEGDEREYTFYWDGRDESGERVPRGLYRVEILLRDQGREILPDESVYLRGGPEPPADGG
jgi:flagellar hook assembly protein FlgD